MKKTALTWAALVLVIFTSYAQQSLSRLVNPFIGTGGHGHTFPGACAPFGMVQLSPDTRLEGWDGCSGYHYSDSLIYGFSHTHLSGTGCSDYGDVMVMPLKLKSKNKMDVFKPEVYRSAFSHAEEKAHAGYYEVRLKDDDIQARLTSTERVGLHEYSFPDKGNYWVVLDLLHRDELLESSLKLVNNHTIEGLRRSKAWAEDQWVYFRIEFNKDFKKTLENNDAGSLKPNRLKGMAWEFAMKKGEKLLVKVSLSATGTAGAALNMSKELPGWDFNQTLQKTEAAWNKELGLIQVESTNPDKKIIFYTALYHTCIQPNLASDVDGKYRGRDGKIHQANGFNYYSVFSLWDTFRAAHPLYNLIQKQRSLDFIKTFLAQYRDGGRLPVWELWGNETDCMIGYHSVSVIADAWAKGIRGFNKQEAIEAMKASAMRDVLGLKAYKEKGYIGIEDEPESVSKTLEYAYDDWCISTLLEPGEDKSYFEKRSQNWKNVFDGKLGHVRARLNGGWFSPFDPREVNNHFTEANSWQYSFFVPQDIPGMIQAYGGVKKFEDKLDRLFFENSATTGRNQADITGLIGQYAHGNEPSHHMAWLYNYLGSGWKTQARIRNILETQYHNAPDGLSGNEDCGQMSAWLVMSSMGLYSVCPGSPDYNISSPWFERIKVNTGDNNQLVINASGAESNMYIKSFRINGNQRLEMQVNHQELMGTSSLFFELSKEPLKWGSKADSTLHSKLSTSILPSPLIHSNGISYRDSQQVALEWQLVPAQLSYRINGGNWINYTKAFYVKESCTIEAKAKDAKTGMESFTQASFHRIPNNWSIQIKGDYIKQYSAGGPEALIDGLKGNENWRKGYWQGYWGVDPEIVIDLKEEKLLEEFGASFLQDSKSWILHPSALEWYVSEDGVNFTPLGTLANEVEALNEDITLKTIRLHKTQGIKAKKLKLIIRQYGKLPKGHISEGEPSYIFVDEVWAE
ncbi:MAG: GH92 family glycosyl hydrolase [Bacteroidia bacterium]|nr:GH92 family glycosyl hydrolase [Bacteroidia bacterium]